MDVKETEKQALKEIKEEDFRTAVEKCKDKLRRKKSLWDIIFPYKIVIIPKEDR